MTFDEIVKRQVENLKALRKLYENGAITKEMYEDGCEKINSKAAELLKKL
ncbi:MAG: hypothetical protein IJP61_03970 [Treponema sp.]|nr:hypothetical protein [Treponema sp.]